MTKFDNLYKTIMNSTLEDITKDKIHELIDAAEDKLDFLKVERVHRILISEKTKNMKVCAK